MTVSNSKKEYHSHNHRVFSCQYHVIWCPKYRRRVLENGIDVRLKEILKETAEMYNFSIIEMEVMPDHVHLIVDCDPEFGIAACIRKLKSRSAHILRKEFPSLKSRIPSLWSRSYFVSSVGAVSLEVVIKYIADQKKV